MSLQFEDQSNILLRKNIYAAPPQGFITRFLFKHNFVKDEKSANQLMLILSAIILLAAITLITINFIRVNTPPKVKYNISQKAFKMLPQDIQIKILEQ